MILLILGETFHGVELPYYYFVFCVTRLNGPFELLHFLQIKIYDKFIFMGSIVFLL